MNTLTEAQRLFFEANGYLVLPGALLQPELNDVQAAAYTAEEPTTPVMRQLLGIGDAYGTSLPDEE